MVAKLNNSDPWIRAKDEQPEVMRSINRTAARITLNGRRHYTTPLACGPVPSVTTIISETASEANKRKLEMWSKNNPGVKEGHSLNIILHYTEIVQYDYLFTLY